MKFNYEIAEVESIPVLTIRKSTTLAELQTELNKAFSTIVNYLTSIGEEPLSPAFTAYYNMELMKMDVEIGFPVRNPVPACGEMLNSVIPGGKQISCLHIGPYSTLESTYAELIQYIEENHYIPTGVAYEFYYNAPGEVPESELRTKIMFPLR